ncbi:hypothetical protein Cni_G12145 [Canna indica]|uniref:Phytocyanin domain-containing protein n=1 Tax=Canna indica TaxID=4628 RepID=A0AAQ3K982_9LILI|nr:hypothetical protein Cni_G12145 [Canna indica]
MVAMLRAPVAVALMAAAALAGAALGKNHIVGSPDGGWDLSTNFTLWSLDNSFNPGDTLTFVYGLTHDVLEVKRSDYDACTAPTTPLSSDRSGNTTIALKAAGMRYFICGVAGHCRSGMKLAISVRAASSPSLPPTSSTAPPPDFPPDAPADAVTPLPPPLLLSPPSPSASTRAASGRVGVQAGFGLMLMLQLLLLLRV